MARLRELSPGQRRLVLLMAVGMAAVGAFAAWAFVSGHPALGIGVLVGVNLLPHFVTLPFRIRRARRAAEAARHRRRETFRPE